MTILERFTRAPVGGAVFSEARDRLAPWLDLNGTPLTVDTAFKMRDESREFLMPADGDVELFFEMWLIENVHGGVDPRKAAS